MRIVDNLFGSQLDNLQTAMTRASYRHSLLADNLANVNTPGYKRKDIDFAITLQKEVDQSSHPFLEGFPTSDSTITPDIDRSSVRVDGSSVDMEREVAEMAETELRFQTLADLTGRYFSNLKSVIREGK